MKSRDRVETQHNGVDERIREIRRTLVAGVGRAASHVEARVVARVAILDRLPGRHRKRATSHVGTI